jgi:heat-inducible transcriptional repressor
VEPRKAAILRAIVEEYIETAQPVGSQTIAGSHHLGVSSATIRNDMTVLEREGYLAQPHTSAGRVPTDLGYRYFVDNFVRQRQLASPDRRAVAEFFASAHRALEDLLHETSVLLARVTDHTAVVVDRPPDAATIKNIQLVSLHPSAVLVVTVLSNGSIGRQVLEVTDVSDSAVATATASLQRSVTGSSLTDLPRVVPTGDPAVDRLVEAAREALSIHAAPAVASGTLYVGGASRLAAEQESFPTGETAARLLEMLEHQVVVVSLVRNLLDQGVTISIGSENEVDDLRDCSIVLAPYAIEGELAGTVGVLGPTRMDYRQALAAVAAVSEQLGRLLS